MGNKHYLCWPSSCRTPCLSATWYRAQSHVDNFTVKNWAMPFRFRDWPGLKSWFFVEHWLNKEVWYKRLFPRFHSWKTREKDEIMKDYILKMFMRNIQTDILANMSGICPPPPKEKKSHDKSCNSWAMLPLYTMMSHFIDFSLIIINASLHSLFLHLC